MRLKVMSISAFFAISVIFTSVSQNVHTNHALNVKVPEYPLFCDEEDIPVTVTFTNCLSRTISIVPESEELGILRGQIAFEYYGTNGVHDLRHRFDKNVAWDRILSFPNLSMLPPGSNCTWNLIGRYIDTYYCAEHSVTGIACRIKVDNNLYIQSLPVAVSFSRHEVPTSEIVFSGQYQVERLGSIPISVCKARVLGTNWLFTVESGMRLCRYNDTEIPQFAMNIQKGEMTIYFQGSTNVVTFDCHTGKIAPKVPEK